MLHNGDQEMRAGAQASRKSSGIRLTGNDLSAAAEGRLEEIAVLRRANGRSGSDARMVPPS